MCLPCFFRYEMVLWLVLLRRYRTNETNKSIFLHFLRRFTVGRLNNFCFRTSFNNIGHQPEPLGLPLDITSCGVFNGVRESLWLSSRGYRHAPMGCYSGSLFPVAFPIRLFFPPLPPTSIHPQCPSINARGRGEFILHGSFPNRSFKSSAVWTLNGRSWTTSTLVMKNSLRGYLHSCRGPPMRSRHVNLADLNTLCLLILFRRLFVRLPSWHHELGDFRRVGEGSVNSVS